MAESKAPAGVLASASSSSSSSSPARNPADIDTRSVLDGMSAQELFGGANARATYGTTFDDLIVLPGFIDFGTDAIDLSAKLTRNITLKLPFVSSPMDTVTESSMAIAMALQGGIGIIHRQCDLEYQVAEVRKVKKHRNGFITDPVCVGPDVTVAEVDKMKYTAVPVTDSGEVGGKLLGIVTSRDIDFLEDRTVSVSSVMTPVDKMTTAKAGLSLEEARAFVKDSKKGKVPVVNEGGELAALISRKDIVANAEFPDASKSLNDEEQLLVGAACGVEVEDRERLRALVEAGVDVIVLDAPQGHSASQIEQLRPPEKSQGIWPLRP